MTTRPTGGNSKPAPATKAGPTRPTASRPSTARTDPSRPASTPRPTGTPRVLPVASGSSAAGPCALPIAAGRVTPASHAAPVGALAKRRVGSCTPPLPVPRRPWALGLARARTPSGALAGVRGLAGAAVPVADATYIALPDGRLRWPGALRCRRIGDAAGRCFHPLRRRWRGTEQRGGRRVAEMAFSVTIAALAVLLTLALVSALLPGAAAVGGVATGFLSLAGGFSGYAAWRWVRWMRDRTERLHWSVLAAVGAAATASELYGAAAIAAGHSGFLERLTALAGFGFAAALTVAVTGVASLVTYHRSVTDAQLLQWAARPGRR
ncbi:hypothetical protein [Cryptosporangium minutisporangium]